MKQLELFEETMKKDLPKNVYMGVYSDKGEKPETASEMCIFVGKRQTLWFGRNQVEGSIYGCVERGTNMIDLDYHPHLTFGVCGYDNPRYNLGGPVWYFKDQTTNKIVMWGKAIRPAEMLHEISKLKHSITGL